MKKIDVKISIHHATGMDGYAYYQDLIVNIGKAITMDDVRKNKKLSRNDNCLVLQISNNNTKDGEWQFARKDIVEFANSVIKDFGYEIVANKTGEHLSLFEWKEDRWV